jgi:hypothetical protein
MERITRFYLMGFTLATIAWISGIVWDWIVKRKRKKDEFANHHFIKSFKSTIHSFVLTYESGREIAFHNGDYFWSYDDPRNCFCETELGPACKVVIWVKKGEEFTRIDSLFFSPIAWGEMAKLLPSLPNTPV